jgi:hypothetical protein
MQDEKNVLGPDLNSKELKAQSIWFIIIKFKRLPYIFFLLIFVRSFILMLIHLRKVTGVRFEVFGYVAGVLHYRTHCSVVEEHSNWKFPCSGTWHCELMYGIDRGKIQALLKSYFSGMWTRTTATMQIFSLLLALIVTTNDVLKLETWNLVWK